MKKTQVIGLIGEAGGGKSTVAKYIQKEHNGYVVDGDHIGHQVLTLPSVIECCVATFGDTIIANEHQIDRQALGAIVFGDSEALQQLNAIVHPVIKERMRLEIEDHLGSYTFILVDGAALIEAGVDTLCDRIVYVHTSKDIRRQRLIEGRGLSEKRADALLSSQQSPTFYRRYADDELVLEGNYETNMSNVQDYIQEIL